jgi:hypothetical protein
VFLILSVATGLCAPAQKVVNVAAGGDVVGASYQVLAAGGGTINLASGNYYITQSIVLGSNMTINGAGGPGSATQSVIYAPPSPNGIAMITTPYEGVQNITISNLVLDGNIPQSAMLYGTGNGNYAYNDTGIYVYSQSNTSVGMNLTNVEVRRTLRGILTGLVDNLTISGCYFHDNNPGGFSHNMYLVATSGVEIDHTRSNDALTGDGLHIDFGGYFYTIRKSEFSGNNGFGILSQQDNSVTVEDSRLDFNQPDGIQIDAGGLLLTRDEMNDNSTYGFEIPNTADGNGQVNGVYTVGNGQIDYFYQASINDFQIYNPGANTYAAVQATGVTGVIDTADWTLNYPGYSYEGAVDFNANHLNGGSITFPYVGATIEGTPGSGTGYYPLVIRYSNGTANNQTLNLSINGGSPVTLNFPATGSYSTWSTITVTGLLNVGNNTVTLSVPAGATSAPELDQLTVTTPTPGVPNAPNNLQGTASSPYSVVLNWTAPANTNNNAAQTYIVYRNGTLVARNIVGTTWTDTKIYYGESTESYFVTAVNQGGQSAQSNTVTVTTGIDAPPGLQVTVSPGTPSNNLSWLGVNGAVNYLVRRSTVSGGPYQTIATVSANTNQQYPSYTDTSLSPGQTYYYVVAAQDANNVISANSYQVTALSEIFTLSAATSAVNLSSAVTSANTITIAGTNGFSDAVTFSVSGLPSGVIAPFSPTSATSGGSTTITFMDSGNAVLGSYPITVTGTDNHLTSSVAFTLNVGLTQTITFNAIGQQAVGNTLAPVATASSGLPITFTVVQNGNCSVSNNVVTFLNGGACGIIANQYGNATYGAADPVGQVVQVRAPVAQTITFNAIATQNAGTTLTLTATANSGLPVSYTSTTQNVCTVSGSIATLSAAGTCTIVASQAGAGQYGPATSVPQSFSIVTQTQTINFMPASPLVYGVAPFTLTGTASSGLPISYSVVSGPGSLNGSTLTLTGAGVIVLAANQVGNNSYTAAPQAMASITVNPAPIAITVNSATKVYGATLPVFTGSLGSTQNGDVLTVNYTTTATPTSSVGTYAITATLTGNAAVNYTATVTPGVLKVTAAMLTATANNINTTYGVAFTPTGTLSGAVALDTFTESFTTSAGAATPVPAGSYTITPSVTATGATNATNYTITLVNAALVVAKANTTTQLISSTSSANQGMAISFTVTVSSSTTGTPTQTVSLMDGTTTLGTATLNAGVATFSISSLSPGVHSISALYSGDINFVGSSSVVITETVATPSFNLSVAPPSVNIPQGQNGSLVLTVSGSGGYAGTVKASCPSSQLPCSFSPSALTFTGANSSQSMNVTIGTVVQARLAAPLGTTPKVVAAMFLWLPGMLAWMSFRWRRSALRMGVGLGALFLLLGLGGLSGCGSTVASNDAAKGSYTFPLVVSDGTNTLSQTVTVVVQ